MCNFYSLSKGQAAIREIVSVWTDRTGNLAPQPTIFPDQSAPVIREGAEGRELVMVRWEMPSPGFALKTRKTDPGVTNIRNVALPHWRRWLGPEHRCLVPFTSFCEYRVEPDKSRTPAWLARGEDRPLTFFAGIWTRWTSVRKIKEGAVDADLYGFPTAEANAAVGAAHQKAMPDILTEPEEPRHFPRSRNDRIANIPDLRCACSILATPAKTSGMKGASTSRSAASSLPIKCAT
ncbi:SOS response-associated peptidase family protein [Citreimonas salinaria]|uniref:Abasic site processing protein n=1 Tax=Citreimonas salinaria TaxID=321339 RepID=A0A1H3P2D9_9RHOB|nr:SOS response-associated peptidase family protein [Citreimonas salinaria]SDY95277.1 Putative SOS response-associated peptidase YedK [Citreimonas salinaria]